MHIERLIVEQLWEICENEEKKDYYCNEVRQDSTEIYFRHLYEMSGKYKQRKELRMKNY